MRVLDLLAVAAVAFYLGDVDGYTSALNDVASVLDVSVVELLK